jgi:MscS family membrane protein
MEFLEAHSFFNNTLLAWSYFIFALLFTFVLTSLLAKYTIKGLEKTADRTKNQFDDILVEIIRSPLKLALKALGIYISFYLITLPDALENLIHNFLNSLIIFSLFWLVHSGVELMTYTLTHLRDKYGKKLSVEVINFLSKGVKVFIIMLGAMSILQQWGLNVSGFVASLGLGGLAFALAAKDTAANLFGSLVIFIDKPFHVGDWIKTPDVEGTIVDIGIRSTKVRTFAQAIVTVPNANLANSAIINWSRMGKRRIKTSLGLTYNTTPEQVKAILADLKSYLIDNDDIDNETIFINFSGFGESTLDIFCYFFTKTTNWGEYMNIKEKVFLEFMKIITEKHQAEFAFPSQSLYIEKGSLA